MPASISMVTHIMAIYGFGARYGDKDKLADFINRGGAFVGYSPEDAPPLHLVLNSIVVGDIVFIKSFSPTSGLYIKAAGIVLPYDLKSPDLSRPQSRIDDNRTPSNPTATDLGWGVPVKWVWQQAADQPFKMGQIDDRWDNLRRGTLYPEFGPKVANTIIHIIVHRTPPTR